MRTRKHKKKKNRLAVKLGMIALNVLINKVNARREGRS